MLHVCMLISHLNVQLSNVHVGMRIATGGWFTTLASIHALTIYMYYLVVYACPAVSGLLDDVDESAFSASSVYVGNVASYGPANSRLDDAWWSVDVNDMNQWIMVKQRSRNKMIYVTKSERYLQYKPWNSIHKALLKNQIKASCAFVATVCMHHYLRKICTSQQRCSITGWSGHDVSDPQHQHARRSDRI